MGGIEDRIQKVIEPGVTTFIEIPDSVMNEGIADEASC